MSKDKEQGKRTMWNSCIEYVKCQFNGVDTYVKLSIGASVNEPHTKFNDTPLRVYGRFSKSVMCALHIITGCMEFAYTLFPQKFLAA